METWPSQFQTLLNVDSFQLQYGDTLVRSQMDIGLDKVRSRYTDAIDSYTCTITIDIALKTILDDFYKTTLGNGSRTFAFDEPFSGVPAEFRFAGPPSITPQGGRVFTVQMKWEKIP